MVKKYLFFFFLFTIQTFFSVSVVARKSQLFNHFDATEILISTADSTIRLNGNILEKYEMDIIEKILGKPNRIKTHTFKSYYEMFGYDNNPPTSIPITVTDYYYIYDQLGIMFYTNNGHYGSKEPVCFSIHFKNKRTFTNTNALPYAPIYSFSGIIKINGNIISGKEKVIPAGVNYNTKEFGLYGLLFGPTSIATVIDRLYSVKCLPNIMLYLNNEKEQKISYVVI